MMTLRPSVSLTRGVPIVEVWWGPMFIATICPPPPGSEIAAFTVVSKYLGEVVRAPGAQEAWREDLLQTHVDLVRSLVQFADADIDEQVKRGKH